MNILSLTDNFLNRITMYRLVLYCLIALLTIAFGLSFLGYFSFNPPSLLLSITTLLVISLVANKIFAKFFNVPANAESVYITALILALIITPPSMSGGWSSYITFLGLAALLAMASKFIIAINKKHIFNPAAFGVALTAFAINQSASWWIGTGSMLWPVLIVGLLIVRKVKRFDLVLSFIGVATATIIGFGLARGVSPITSIWTVFLHTPALFFGLIMLTEPLTTPPDKNWRMMYGALTGFLFSPSVHIGSIYSTPELALLVGNIFSYIVSPKEKLILVLKEKYQIAKDIYEFIFTPDRSIKFKAGQYLEWTLGHSNSDTRGNRRYFTIASSPTEKDIRLGIKFYQQSSSFKKSLLMMKTGESVIASQLAGEFTLPEDTNQKLVFIAGGIGVTPFRSMVKYLLDRKESRPITLLYSSNTVQDFAYTDIFKQAEQELGIKTVYALTDTKQIPPDWHGHQGFVDSEFVIKEIPDYKENIFYISGPRTMVVSFEKALKELGVQKRHIKVDYFPGFA